MSWKYTCPTCNTSFIVSENTPKVFCGCGSVDLKPKTSCIQITDLLATPCNKWLPSLKCEYQGELVGKVDCNCAATKPVYECSIHTYCTPRPTVYNRIKTLEGDVLSVTLKGCSKCQEKKPGPDNEP